MFSPAYSLLTAHGIHYDSFSKYDIITISYSKSVRKKPDYIRSLKWAANLSEKKEKLIAAHNIPKKLLKMLFSLLRKKHFNSLSVASVCREADIGRNTFYSHYDSLIDVIDELAEDAIQATSRPKGNSLKEISELAALLRQKNYSEDKAAQLMLELPVCQRIADNPKYSPLFKDPFIA
ncbi:MAG: hypothetical protein ABS874_09565, partial [Lachnospiraceae bacterium]